MSKRPRPTVTVTAKLSPDLADGFYKLVNGEFGGNLSEALREAIKLLISTSSLSRHKLSPDLAESFYKLVNEEFGGN